MGFKLNYKDEDVLSIMPNGDRYLVEILETDEVTTVKGLDGSEKQLYVGAKDEMERGWVAAVVMGVGNGHRLEVPDHVAVLDNHMDHPRIQPGEDIHAFKKRQDEHKLQAIMNGAMFATEEHVVVRPPASVPMFFGLGNVVALERLTGRQFKLNTGRVYRIVSQVDILWRFVHINLRLVDGEWITEQEFAKLMEKITEEAAKPHLVAVGDNHAENA